MSTCPEIWSTVPAGSNPSFIFSFDPSVSDRVAEAAQEIKRQGCDARSPFDPGRRLVDWSQEQMEQYREQEIDGACEARSFLSPYLLPLPIESVVPEVEELLREGHVTVVRLRLDGGRAGARKQFSP